MILHDDVNEMCCLYDSTTMTAFGPVFEDGENWDCVDYAEDFIAFVLYTTGNDPRALGVLWNAYHSVWLAFHGVHGALQDDAFEVIKKEWIESYGIFLTSSDLLETSEFWQALLSKVSFGNEFLPWILQTPETPESGKDK